MSKNIKIIIVGVVILGLLSLLAFVAFNNKAPGGIIAGLAGVWAAIKSKVFTSQSLKERLAEIDLEHAEKSKEWDRVKEGFDSKYQALKARMDYLDYKSAKISEQLKQLDEEEKKKLKQIDNMTRDEKLELLSKI